MNIYSFKGKKIETISFSESNLIPQSVLFIENNENKIIFFTVSNFFLVLDKFNKILLKKYLKEEKWFETYQIDLENDRKESKSESLSILHHAFTYNEFIFLNIVGYYHMLSFRDKNLNFIKIVHFKNGENDLSFFPQSKCKIFNDTIIFYNMSEQILYFSNVKEAFN